jgi:hypothetical protein
MKWSNIGVPALLAAVQACSAGGSSSGVKSSSSGGGSNGAAGSLNLGTGGGGLIIDTPIEPGGNDLGIATGVILTPECAADCTTFSAPSGSEPLVVTETGVSAADRAMLDAGGGAAGPCISEPADGTIFPAAWTRPRFNYAGATGAHKITLQTAKMRHALTIYAAKLPYVLPKEIWNGLSRSVYNEDIEYTVKAASGAEAKGAFQIAPVAAGGSMVFWGSTGTQPGEMTNALYGFGVGDEGVIRAVAPGEIKGSAVSDNGNLRKEFTTTAGHSTCVGCHASTPDGQAVASMDHWSWNIRLYSIEPGSTGAPPDYLTGAGAAMLSMTWLGGPTFSKGVWGASDRRMVTTWSERTLGVNDAWKSHDGSVYSNFPTQLVWMDLAATAAVPVDIARTSPDAYMNTDQALQKAVAGMKGTGWEVIARTGDANSPVLPDFSHDGKTIAYTSTDKPQDGRIGGATVVDLYTVPFNDGAGGEAKPVAGADTADFEYYPDYSPDDALLAFNKLPKFATNPGREDSFDHVYYRPQSEIHVVSSAGGTPTRLLSNDAVCEGKTGELYNSWAKWAPTFASDGQTTYYFLIFSTARNSPFAIPRGQDRKSPASQLYMTTIIKRADGSIVSSPAIYLWNQRSLVQGSGPDASVSELLTNNVTPAWDEFKIPPVPPVVVK